MISLSTFVIEFFTNFNFQNSLYLKNIQHTCDLHEALQKDNNSFQSLSHDEIQQLERNGNQAEDWRNVLFFQGATKHLNRIHRCTFQGKVLLGSFKDTVDFNGIKCSSGLFDSFIIDSIIEDNVLIMKTCFLSNTHVHSFSIVLNCGQIISSKSTNFGNNNSLCVGVEQGGRNMPCFLDMSFDLACKVVTSREDNIGLEQFSDHVKKYTTNCTSQYNIFLSKSNLLHCSFVKDVYVGECGTISNSTVLNTTLFSTLHYPSSIQSNSIVKNSLIQHNCHIEQASCIEDCFLYESSSVKRHGKVFHSFLGPMTSIAEGEVTSCFLGPFVGFHHQALLIACVWTEGKGNVGYGANVGSNHTLKAPDQELIAGEGIFFGLGCCVKFPSNFQSAPYSVLATGVNTLPQKLLMPFSLINIPQQNLLDVSPAFNEIIPGWVLKSSIFTVLRNEHKFKTRNKSNQKSIESNILLRPDLVKMMQNARNYLERKKEEIKKIYVENQIYGIGKNYLTEKDRVNGIETYTRFIQHYALNGLLRECENNNTNINNLLNVLPPLNTRWRHEYDILKEEFPTEKNVSSLLKLLVLSYESIAKDAEEGKARDDERGGRIIDDYKYTHAPASKENIVLLANQKVDEIRQRVFEFVSRL